MSDECLMKQVTVFSFYIVYQAVMRKFTLAGKADNGRLAAGVLTMDDIHAFVKILIVGSLPLFSHNDETVKKKIILHHTLTPTIVFLPSGH